MVLVMLKSGFDSEGFFIENLQILTYNDKKYNTANPHVEFSVAVGYTVCHRAK